MNANERVLRTLEGKSVDRVPTFCAGVEDSTFNEVLGKPSVSPKKQFGYPLTRSIPDRRGPEVTKDVQPKINSVFEKRIKAACELGFDSTWALLDETFTMLDHNTMARSTGSIFNLQPDGFGNMTYMYRGPGIKNREDFESWPYWPDPDKLAHSTYGFFKKMVANYGEKMCLFGQSSAYGIQEALYWAIGIERLLLWIRREKDLVNRYINLNEQVCMKTAMAMLDAGVPVILQSDDFAFKSGPIMNPKLVDEIFGGSYRKIVKAVHDRGGKYVFHSCGDNTLLFDTFISWGVDGLHAYENTSNVDIFHEKKVHGDKVTIIGGVRVDYLLTDRSTDDEVVEGVKKLIAELGPGGRFIISPVHSLSGVPAHKLAVMVEAVNRYGSYPIAVS